MSCRNGILSVNMVRTSLRRGSQVRWTTFVFLHWAHVSYWFIWATTCLPYFCVWTRRISNQIWRLIFWMTHRLCMNWHKICWLYVCHYARDVTEMHVILYRGNNQLNVLEMPPEDCIDCLREYPCYPQIPPLSAGHSAAGLGSFVLFWFKPVSQARLSRSGAWNAFFCLHLLSWLHLKKKKLYEGVVESFAHYNLSDLTLEMKLNVAGISLPPIVLMLTFVSWSVLFSSWLGFCSIDGHLFSDSLQVYKSLIMRNRSSFQQGKGQQRIYYCPCCCHFQYHNDLIPLPYLSVLLKPHMHGFL